MKKKYEEPRADILLFKNEVILNTSGGWSVPELPIDPAKPKWSENLPLENEDSK